MKDFVLAAQNIFPNRPLERKRPKSALLFINLNTFMEKNRAWLWTKTIYLFYPTIHLNINVSIFIFIFFLSTCIYFFNPSFKYIFFILYLSISVLSLSLSLLWSKPARITITHPPPPGAAWCIWGPKAKIDYFVLDAKLLLINMNYIEFFLFFLEIL